MSMNIGAAILGPSAEVTSTIECVPDAYSFSQAKSPRARLILMVLAVTLGVMLGSLMKATLPPEVAYMELFVVLAFVGGLLSTWSPCGYSSLSLLRPAGRYTIGSVTSWAPTFFTHALGYAAGAVVLGGGLGFIGWLLFSDIPAHFSIAGLAILALGYGAHQLGFMKMPYPQRRAQVPHDARFRFKSSVIGLLYGFSLGMNYLTYVQTPMLYIVTGVALFSGSVKAAIVAIALFNIGRCLPVAINFLPVKDQSVQAWLARWQESAVEVDGVLLLAIGSAALAMLVL